MKLVKGNLLAVILGLFLAVTAFAASNTQTQSIAQITANNPQFSTLEKLLKEANLTRTLNRRGPYTIFAPTNRAFQRLPKRTLKRLQQNPKLLKKVLLYHVVSGKVTSNMIKPGRVKTMEGQTIKVKDRRGRVYVNRAKVVKRDIGAKNGVIHVINRVLLPPKDRR